MLYFAPEKESLFMKKYIFALVLLISVFSVSCSIEEPQKNPDLISKWELTEILYNDGSRSVYKPADYSETIEFLVDSKVKRSTSWCPEANVNLAEYSSEENQIIAGCGENALTLKYAVKGDLLFIYPNCVEECALKYRRIDNLVGFIK